MIRLLPMAALAGAVLALAGCANDPYAPRCVHTHLQPYVTTSMVYSGKGRYVPVTTTRFISVCDQWVTPTPSTSPSPK